MPRCVSQLAHAALDERPFLLALGIISFGSFLAFIYNIAVYYFILYTSALSCTIGANAIKILLIVISAIESTGGDTVALMWVGIVIVIVSVDGMSSVIANRVCESAPFIIVANIIVIIVLVVGCGVMPSIGIAICGRG